MALLILKKKPAAAPAAQPPAPIVEPEKPKHSFPNTWKDLPVATSVEELWASRNTLRPPEPTQCRLCGKLYAFPCHGDKDTCMGKKFKEASDASA